MPVSGPRLGGADGESSAAGPDAARLAADGMSADCGAGESCRRHGCTEGLATGLAPNLAGAAGLSPHAAPSSAAAVWRPDLEGDGDSRKGIVPEGGEVARKQASSEGLQTSSLSVNSRLAAGLAAAPGVASVGVANAASGLAPAAAGGLAGCTGLLGLGDSTTALAVCSAGGLAGAPALGLPGLGAAASGAPCDCPASSGFATWPPSGD